MTYVNRAQLVGFHLGNLCRRPLPDERAPGGEARYASEVVDSMQDLLLATSDGLVGQLALLAGIPVGQWPSPGMAVASYPELARVERSVGDLGEGRRGAR